MINYSRNTLLEMFDGMNVSPILPYDSLDADEAIARRACTIIYDEL